MPNRSSKSKLKLDNIIFEVRMFTGISIKKKKQNIKTKKERKKERKEKKTASRYKPTTMRLIHVNDMR